MTVPGPPRLTAYSMLAERDGAENLGSCATIPVERGKCLNRRGMAGVRAVREGWQDQPSLGRDAPWRLRLHRAAAGWQDHARLGCNRPWGSDEACLGPQVEGREYPARLWRDAYGRDKSRWGRHAARSEDAPRLRLDAHGQPLLAE